LGTLTVLFVGYGSIAKKHHTALLQLAPNVQVLALRSSTTAEVIVGVKNCFDIKEVIQLITFSIVSNPSSLHADTIEQLVQYGKPIFIEKPVVTTLEQAEKLKPLTKNIITYVACNLRFTSLVQYLQLHLPLQKVQEVQAYCGSYLPNWRPTQNFRESYSTNPALGGGVHLDLIHEIDYLYFLFGKPLSSFNHLLNNSLLQIPAVDSANYWLCYKNFTATVTLNYFRTQPKRTCEIVLDDDVWLVDFLDNKITSSKHNILFTGTNTIADTYLAQMQYFIQKLTINEPCMNSFEEAVNVLSIALPTNE